LVNKLRFSVCTHSSASRATPARLAGDLVSGPDSDWAELNDSTTRLAAGMVKSLGVRRGDHVAILDKNTDR
jgi:acyl-CoA synthetase (AMP-forming)/AMP-acid ligase II